jgi:D-serine deaminase-like pyridoxal phosphate-dependent protein
MTTRRAFFSGAVSTAAAAPLLARPAAKSDFRYTDVEARIAKRDFKGLVKEDLPTPSMIVDLDLFEKNIKHMADHCKSAGINLRAHVKIHKSPEIAKRQAALGAIGVCCATIAEAELMVQSGIRGVLFTCQPTGKNKISRAVALAKRDPTFHAVADDPIIATQLQEAAEAARAQMNVFVDVFAGLTRQGCQPGEKAFALARQVSGSKNLRLAGLMAYSGDASHTKTFAARTKRSRDDLAGMLETAEMCKRAGIEVKLKTGGSTGTYNIDVGTLSELQAGSFVFMDTVYRKVGGKSSDTVYEDFAPALTVMTTVVSKTRAGTCSIDAGNKALLRPTDEVKGRSDVEVKNQGAEYGMLVWKDGDRDYKVGDRVEVYPSNLDMSTNVYDRYYIARGEQIVDVWPIMGRAGAAQR